MIVYGIYSDEGLIEGDFYSVDDAREAIESRYDPDDGLWVGRIAANGEDEWHWADGMEA